jgi:hypothetical protein
MNEIFCAFFFMQQGQIILCHQNCNGHSCKASEAAEKSNVLTGGDEYVKRVHKICLKHHTTEIVFIYRLSCLLSGHNAV